MYTFRRKILINAFKLYDLVTMGFSLIFSILAVSNDIAISSFSKIGQIEIKILNLAFFLLALFTWQIIFSNFKLYHSKRLSEQSKVISDVLKATSLGAVLILIEGILLRINVVSIPVIAVFWLCCSIIAILSRMVLSYFLGRIRVHGRNLRHLLMIGTNPRAVQFAETILASPELGYRFVGFVDDEWVGINNLEKTENKLVCDLNSFQVYVREKVIDVVIVALPIKSFYDRALRIISICEQQGILVRYLSSIFDIELPNLKKDQFQNYYLIPLSYETIYGYPSLLKRLMDIVFSAAVLLLTAPLFLGAAGAIKMTSPGPVFFIQERVGFGKRKFRLYKFRTMTNDAEQKQAALEYLNEAQGPVFKIKNDPRITKVGKFLRKTSIDELPQLINILKGDMSIVGPRPLPVRDYNGFNQDWHRRRFSVRPGITCLWQVEGRCTIPFDKWMELDMEYIDHWSLWLDFKILAKTIPTVLKGSGAV